MKISLQEAAVNLERLCDEIECVDDITDQLQVLFGDAKLDLKDSVDRRIALINYANSQVEAAKEMCNGWANRRKKFETIIEHVKASTLNTMKAFPNLSYTGNLGSFQIRKSPPSLVVHDRDKIDNEFFIVELRIDHQKLKSALKDGREIQGVSLEQSDHVRISLTK